MAATKGTHQLCGFYATVAKTKAATTDACVSIYPSHYDITELCTSENTLKCREVRCMVSICVSRGRGISTDEQQLANWSEPEVAQKLHDLNQPINPLPTLLVIQPQTLHAPSQPTTNLMFLCIQAHRQLRGDGSSRLPQQKTLLHM